MQWVNHSAAFDQWPKMTTRKCGAEMTRAGKTVDQITQVDIKRDEEEKEEEEEEKSGRKRK